MHFQDLPVDDIHTMQAVQRIHRNLADPSLPVGLIRLRK